MTFALLAVGIVFIAALLMFILIQQASREREALRVTQAEFRRDLDKLKNDVDKDRQTYGNRGVVQKALLLKAFENKWFTGTEKEILLGVAEGAMYPKDDLK